MNLDSAKYKYLEVWQEFRKLTEAMMRFDPQSKQISFDVADEENGTENNGKKKKNKGKTVITNTSSIQELNQLLQNRSKLNKQTCIYIYHRLRLVQEFVLLAEAQHQNFRLSIGAETEIFKQKCYDKVMTFVNLSFDQFIAVLKLLKVSNDEISGNKQKDKTVGNYRVMERRVGVDYVGAKIEAIFKN